MASIDAALSGARAAVDELIATADRCAAVWQTPRAPGKWSASQLVEHVARALDQSAHEVAGRPSLFPTIPAVIRPLVRTFLFNRVLKKGTFPKARTSAALNPASGPATPAEGRKRLLDACALFDSECRAAVASGRIVDSKLFGVVPVEKYVRFQELHTRHHRAQIAGLPAAQSAIPV